MKNFLVLIILGMAMVACTDLPDSAEEFYKFGLASNKNNDPETGPDYKDQVLLFDEALRTKPRNYSALVKRADVAMQYREFRDAVAYYSQAIKVGPKKFEIYNKRGEAYFRLAKYQPAMKDFQQAITLNPRDVTAPLNLCYLFVASKQFQNATRYCNRVLALEAGNPYAVKLLRIIATSRKQ